MRAELQAQSRRALWLGLAVFAYALGLRVGLLGGHALHMDEALYAGFSRRILHGDLLLTGGLNNDKPPLQFYLGALSMGLFGDREANLRLLNAVASALECGLLSWALWPLAGFAGAALGGALLASSPLSAGYGSSFLMDGPLSLLIFASFVAATRKQAGLAGLLWALACAAKQTAYFLLPLPLLALLLAGSRDWVPFAKGAAAGLVPLWLWSALFQHPRLGMVVLMKANQPEVGLGASGPGPAVWLDLARRGFARAGAFNAVAALGLLAWPWLAWRSRHDAARRPWALAPLVVPGLLLLFVGLGMRGFDRYWLPALPFVASLPALALASLPMGALRRGLGALALIAVALTVAQGRRLDVSGLQGSGWSGNDDLRSACQWLKVDAPEGGILAGPLGGLHWLGNWYLGRDWTLFEAPPPGALSGMKALATDEHPLYWIAPAGAGIPEAGWLRLPAPDGLSLQRWSGARP